MSRRNFLISEIPNSSDGDIPSYAFASLPAAGIAGRLARVSDTDGGLWMDTSLAWSKVSIPINPMDAPFNCVGDGVTDDSVGMQAALTRGAASGRKVVVPYSTSTTNFYMGTTGLTMNGVTLEGQGATALTWAAGFTGTAITMTSHDSILRDLGLYMPGNAGVPNSGIIGVDVRRIRCLVQRVFIGPSTLGLNSPWFTGVKIGDVNNRVLDCEIQGYNHGILGYTASGATGGRNNIVVDNCLVSSQVTACIDLPDFTGVDIRGNELNAGEDPPGSSLYCISCISAAASGPEGINITGNYMQGATNAGVLIDSVASTSAKGIHIAGNFIYTANATSAIRIKRSEGAVIVGNSLHALSYSLYLGVSNLDYVYAGNKEVGCAFSFDTTISADLQPDYVGSWTPSVGGDATYTTQSGKWWKSGRMVTVQCKLIINVLGTGSTTTISGLPYTSQSSVDFPIAIGFFSTLAGGNFVWIGGVVNATSTTVGFITMAAAGATATAGAAIFGDSARIDFTATYFTD